MLKDIETGQSRRMGYVTFEDGRSLTEAIEEMHDAVCTCFKFACLLASARLAAGSLWLRFAAEDPVLIGACRHVLPGPPAPLLLSSVLPPKEFCTEPQDNAPAICTKLVVTEAKPEKQTW